MHKSQESILWNLKHQVKTFSNSHTRIVDHLFTSALSNGIGSYASQPHGTYRATPTMLMETMNQPQTHTKQTSMANTHTKQYND